MIGGIRQFAKEVGISWHSEEDVLIGYKHFIQNKVAEKYLQGNITLSEAAHQAGFTIWDMEKYLVEHGFKSSYSIEDLARELKILDRS